MGNYIEDSVPVAMDEAENKVERTWGDDKKKAKAALSHHEVMYRLGAYDPERGVKLVGHRGYCLTGMGFFLNQALINYGVQFLASRSPREAFSELILLTVRQGLHPQSTPVSHFTVVLTLSRFN